MNRAMRGIAAAALALAVVLTGAAPAYGTGVPPPPPRPPDRDNSGYWNIGVDLLRSLLDKGSDGSLSPAELTDLVNELINGINGVKVDLLGRLDSELVNELRAKADTATTSVVYLRLPQTTAVYLGIVNPAAHSAKAHVDTVQSDSARDAVGRAMITLYTALEVTEAKLGIFDPRVRYADYRQGLENLVSKMRPKCIRTGHANHLWYTCEFDGYVVEAFEAPGPDFTRRWSINGGPFYPGKMDSKLVEKYTMAGTARELADEALAELTRKGY